VFISDLHLAPGQNERLDAFVSLIESLAAHRVAALYILGDLFEAWPGDDAGDAGLGQAVGAALSSLAPAGIKVSFIAGNRDFLLGERFAGPLGIDILADPTVVTAGGVQLVLTHGDLLCTDDIAYQAYRSEVRDPQWQARFLAQSLKAREAIAADLRAKSESAKSGKAAEIMDVNADAVANLLAQHPRRILLHGHTHRPRRHELLLDGVVRERWVLPDWDPLADPPRGGGVLAREGRLVPFGLTGLHRL